MLNESSTPSRSNSSTSSPFGRLRHAERAEQPRGVVAQLHGPADRRVVLMLVQELHAAVVAVAGLDVTANAPGANISSVRRAAVGHPRRVLYGTRMP